jgi:hypothetical protein
VVTPDGRMGLAGVLWFSVVWSVTAACVAIAVTRRT